jgi:hypothetical protein
MKVEDQMDWMAFIMWLVGMGLIVYSLGFIAAIGLFFLFASDNAMACRRLEKMGFTDWWKYQ